MEGAGLARCVVHLSPTLRCPWPPPCLQGAPFCFWSNHQSEAILCFDLRMRRCLYELATGNTDVHDLQVRAPLAWLRLGKMLLRWLAWRAVCTAVPLSGIVLGSARGVSTTNACFPLTDFCPSS